jgi:hypothetical protein
MDFEYLRKIAVPNFSHIGSSLAPKAPTNVGIEVKRPDY